MKKIIFLIFLLSQNIITAQEKYNFIIPTKYVDCQIENKNTIIGYKTDGYDEQSGDFYDISGKIIIENTTKIKIYNNCISGFLDNKNNYCFLTRDNTIVKNGITKSYKFLYKNYFCL